MSGAPTHDQVADFWNLFDGRTDAYGSDEGGCVREPVGIGLFQQHLKGTRGIGIYPLRDDNTVKWGCVDFDEGDERSWVHARNLRMVLAEFAVEGWIERSRSKGYHVWVFCDGWHPAELVRTALLAACQLAGAPTKEVNPKQTDVAALNKGYGNYVRLPYKGWFQALVVDKRPWSGLRQVIVDEQNSPFWFDTFLLTAAATTAVRTRLEELAKLYEPPKFVAPPPPPDWNLVNETDMHRRMSGLAWTIYQEGPLPGPDGRVDRSDGLYKLACLLREGGKHTFAEAVELVTEADRRWGKFYDRADGEQRLHGTVSRAWGR